MSRIDFDIEQYVRGGRQNKATYCCLRELGRVRQLPCPLPGGFIHVDGKKAERSAGALGF